MKKLFAVMDTETNGLTLHPEADLDLQPRCIEFGGVLTDGNKIYDTLEFICNPGIQIEPIITKITGLTNGDLRMRLPFKDYIPELNEFFKGADVVVSHNLSFDRNILKYDLMRCGKTLADINWPQIEICTIEQTVDRYGWRVSLSELYETFCGPYIQKHRAVDDTRLLVEVCREIGVFDIFNNMD